jgi:hypothetical protein
MIKKVKKIGSTVFQKAFFEALTIVRLQKKDDRYLRILCKVFNFDEIG